MQSLRNLNRPMALWEEFYYGVHEQRASERAAESLRIARQREHEERVGKLFFGIFAGIFYAAAAYVIVAVLHFLWRIT